MDNDNICIKAATCPIYNDILQSNEFMIQIYKSMYCENGEEGRNNCKRYQVFVRAGKCPPDILPNNDLPVDTIVMLMN